MASSTTFTAPNNGIYNVSTGVYMTSVGAVDTPVRLSLWINNALYRILYQQTVLFSKSGEQTIGGSCDVLLSSGDVLDVRLANDGGADLNVLPTEGTYFTVHRIADIP